jgi:hypothetical protein
MLDPGVIKRADLCHPVAPLQIDVHHGAELLGCLSEGGDGGADACVVDQHVKPAEAVDGGGRERRAVGRFGGVGGDGHRAAVDGLDGFRGLGEPLRSSGAQDDVGAGVGERHGEPCDEARARARDDGDPAVEPEQVENRVHAWPPSARRSEAASGAVAVPTVVNSPPRVSPRRCRSWMPSAMTATLK